MQKKKVLVTGATGFIGQYVIQGLQKKSNIQIFAITRNAKKAASLESFSKLNVIETDIVNLNARALQNFGNIDAVIHLAWDGLPNYKESFHIEKNLFDSYNFCKRIIDLGIKNLSVVGTCFEYGMVNGCLPESLESRPNNSYAVAKDSLRKFIELLATKNSFSFKWIRLFYMYGKGQAKNSLISQLDDAIVRKDESFNMSGGEQLRDYLHVSEVAENIVSCSLQTDIPGIINCCSGKPISVRSFVENYLKERNVNMKLNLGYYPYADYEPMAFWGDNTKLKRILESSN